MSNQDHLALLERRLGYAEVDLASARQEVADADERAAHYYQLLVVAEAEVEALTARVAELKRENTLHRMAPRPLFNRCEAAESEVALLREALTQIATAEDDSAQYDTTGVVLGRVVSLARAALAEGGRDA